MHRARTINERGGDIFARQFLSKYPKMAQLALSPHTQHQQRSSRPP